MNVQFTYSLGYSLQASSNLRILNQTVSAYIPHQLSDHTVLFDHTSAIASHCQYEIRGSGPGNGMSVEAHILQAFLFHSPAEPR